MTNPPIEHEPVVDQSNTPLSAAALEFANILGGALARQWIQQQAEAIPSDRPVASDVHSGCGLSTHPD